MALFDTVLRESSFQCKKNKTFQGLTYFKVFHLRFQCSYILAALTGPRDKAGSTGISAGLGIHGDRKVPISVVCNVTLTPYKPEMPNRARCWGELVEPLTTMETVPCRPDRMFMWLLTPDLRLYDGLMEV